MNFRRLLIIAQIILLILVVADARVLQQFPNKNHHHDRYVSSSRDLVKAYDRAEAAANLFKTVMDGPKERAFPEIVLNTAQAIAIFPARLKYSAVSDHRGNGLVSMRDPETGLWQPPIFININGEIVKQYLDDKNDLILFALNRNAMRAFFSSNFKVEKTLPSLEMITQPVEELSMRFNFVAYMYGPESLSIINIENANIVHDGSLNFAVYGTRKIKPFLPTGKLISNRVLVFPATLNLYNRKS